MQPLCVRLSLAFASVGGPGCSTRAASGSWVSPRSSPLTQPPAPTRCSHRGGVAGGLRGHRGSPAKWPPQPPAPGTHHADLGADEQVGHDAWGSRRPQSRYSAVSADGARRRCGRGAGQSGARAAVPPPGGPGGGRVPADSSLTCGRSGPGSCRPFALFLQHLLRAQGPESGGRLRLPPVPTAVQYENCAPVKPTGRGDCVPSPGRVSGELACTRLG